MESKEIIYYCEQGDPYCQSPKCRCNTVRPEKVKEQPKQGQSLPIDHIIECNCENPTGIETAKGVICFDCEGQL